MYDFIRNVIAAIAAPRGRLFINSAFWRNTLHELNRRGREEVESGVFLLGKEVGNRRYVCDQVFYDDLDPHCADTGGIHLDHRALGDAWKLCKERGLTVVADVHTHPGRADQSSIDAENPAISIPGHVALIVPDFARANGESRLGVYEYVGNHRWNDRRDKGFVQIAWWL